MERRVERRAQRAEEAAKKRKQPRGETGQSKVGDGRGWIRAEEEEEEVEERGERGTAQHSEVSRAILHAGVQSVSAVRTIA